MLRSLWAFSAVAALLTVTPGLDTVLVLRSSIAGGRRAGAASALGVCCGLLVWGLATALGVAALLAASVVAYDAIRIAGAVYLVVLGVRTLLALRRDGEPPEVVACGQRTPGTAFRQGLTTNLLNPKVGVFYVTLLPQFVPEGAPVLATTLLLAGVHALQGVLWLGGIAWAAGRARALLSRAEIRRRLEAVTGLVFIGFGVRLALSRRALK